MTQPADNKPAATFRIPRPLRKLCLGATFVFAGVLLVLSFLENKLVYPIPPIHAADWAPAFPLEEAAFQAADGTELHGWLLESHPDAPWVLYCHGNGDQVANSGAWLSQLRDKLPANIFVFDYRGYGKSAGSPTEAGVLSDGEAALDWICQRSGCRPERIILMGRSLGGAVAVHLASEHGAAGLVLERTFTRLTDAAKARFWWAPVNWLMRNRYHSIEKIPRYDGPLLSSHGTRDDVVPYHLGVELFSAAGAPDSLKTFVELPNVGHNGPNTEEYLQTLFQFIRDHGVAAR
ncbi:MAG: alpha/beta hydrolase [Planctomycetales bacterium]|nr:alpha/beta hydrolase [Planctomycetales bacterium]